MSISDVNFAEDAINSACASLGLQIGIKVVSVTNRWRWTLEFTQSSDHPDFGKNMIKLERLVQDRLKRPIDLRLETEADKNMRKKRNVLSGSK